MTEEAGGPSIILPERSETARLQEFERLLYSDAPDCRLQDLSARRRTAVAGPNGQPMERVFCGNCGADGGAVTADWSPHVFYLCNDCARKHGNLPLVEIPEDVVRGKKGLLDP